MSAKAESRAIRKLPAGVFGFVLIPRESVAATDSTSRRRRLVGDQTAAAIGEDGRATANTCAVLLDGVCRRTSDESTARGDVATDRSVPI